MTSYTRGEGGQQTFVTMCCMGGKGKVSCSAVLIKNNVNFGENYV